MTGAAWLQLLALVAFVVAGTRAPRPLPRRRVRRRRARASAIGCSSTDRAPDLPAVRDRPRPRAALEHLRLLAPRLQRGVGARALRPAALPGVAAVQPHRRRRGARGALVQHRGQLRDQHELAELRRREHDELPHADGGAGGAELRVGRGRHLRGGRPHPRPGPPAIRRPSATSGSTSCAACVRVLLPLAIVLAVVLVSQGAIQTLRGPETVTTLEQATQSIPGGPFASQEAIKELGTNGGGTLNANSAHALRQPERLHQPAADGRHPAHPVRPHLRLRADGQGPEAGLGRVRRDVPAVGRLRRPGHRLRGGRQPVGRRPRRQRHPGGHRRAGRRQHGGQGGPLRAGRLRRCSPPPPRARRPARSSPPTTASPRWAGPRRSST